MQAGRCTRWPRVHPAIVVAVVVPSCATIPTGGPHLVQPSCEFIVHNRTPLALEIRLQVRALSTAPIGVLNPGELLTHSVPCAQRRVWVAGIELPWQVGARARFGVVHGAADLVERERIQIALHWP